MNLASQAGHFEICELLIKSGADPDAKIPSKEITEFGIPICNAIKNKDYELANLLLDSGANPNAFPYCDTPMVETLYFQARANGVEQEIIKYGFSSYLKEEVDITKYRNGHSSVKTLVRILEYGVIPNISPIVRDEHTDLIRELLESCTDNKVSSISYPQGTIFEGIVYCSSWYGYPEIVKLTLEKCPELFTIEVALQSIRRGIISHNRDGDIVQYSEMIEFLLTFLHNKSALDQLNSASDLNPFHLIAEHFCWPRNYGFKAAISTPEDIIKITQLFLNYGFSNYNEKHPKTGKTAIELAQERINHKGMEEFIAFVSKLN